MTNNEELILLDQAISDILQYGQTLSVLGRSLTRADLKDLYARRSVVITAIARGSKSTGSIMYGVPYG